MAMTKYRSLSLLSIIVLSVIGFFTVRMPWLEYPKLQLVFEGRHGVGWFTSILFLAILLLALAMLLFKIRNRLVGGSMFIIGLFLSIVGLDKIIRFYFVWQYESSDFVLFNIASAGMMMRYGVYVLTVCAALVTFLSLPFIFPSLMTKDQTWGKLMKYGSLAILVIAGVIAVILMRPVSELSQSEVKESLSLDYKKMNQALMNGEFDQVVEHTHPIVYQSMGGKSELINILRQVQDQSKRIDSKVTEVVKFEQKGREVQAIFHHQTDFVTQEGEETTRGSSFGFSHDAGRTWVFAGINGKSFKEMKEMFPDIFNELDYSVGQNKPN